MRPNGKCDTSSEPFNPKSLHGLSLVVPIKARRLDGSLYGFADHYRYILQSELHFNLELVVADESEPELARVALADIVGLPNFVHVIPKDRSGLNDKLNGVLAALRTATYERIMLLDDHYRVTTDEISRAYRMFEDSSVFRGFPAFAQSTLGTNIDLAGAYVLCALSPTKQYFGHLCFCASAFRVDGFSRDALFDELSMERHIEQSGFCVRFVEQLTLSAIQRITFRRFLEQRVRYAYENLAFPARFGFFLAILPTVSYLGIRFGVIVTLVCILGLSLLVFLAGLYGWLRYGRGRMPFTPCLLVAVWFWIYPFTTWVALWCLLRGGVVFGGNRIRAAA